jgi:hypothetical protein
VPFVVYAGGALASDGSNIYCLRGNADPNFAKYNIATNTWTNLTSTKPVPFYVYDGGALVYDGSDNIYCTGGNYSANFAKYNISTDTWTNLTSTKPVPFVLSGGGALAYDGSNIYCIEGVSANNFAKFNIATSTWTDLTSTKPVPFTVYTGGALAYDGSGNIYCTGGNATTAFAKYNIATNTWTNLTSTKPVPFTVNNGGAITYDGSGNLYCIGGSGTAKFAAYTSPYLSSGTYTSNAIDTGAASPAYATLNWNATIPAQLQPAGPIDNYTKLLLHFNGANGSTTFTDSETTPKTVTANGNAQISTAQSKFGGASGLFDGTGDYLTLADSADFAFGTEDFTIDTWAYVNTASSRNVIFNSLIWNSDGGGFQLYVDSNLKCRILQGNFNRVTTATALSAGWNHIALVRIGNVHTFYINGVADANTGNFAANYANQVCKIGVQYDGSYSWNGYLDEFRISKGIARWTSNFTLPVNEYSNTVPLQFQLASAATQGDLASATWYGPTGTSDYYTTSGTAINATHRGNRWIQYKATLTTVDTAYTPTLNDVTINYTGGGASYTQATSSDVAISPAAIDHYVVASGAAQTAGTGWEATITAYDQYNNVVTTDSTTVVTMAANPATTATFYTDNTYTTVNTAKTYTLASGVATAYIKNNVTETLIITATDANSKVGALSNIVINPATAAKIVFTSNAQALIAGIASSAYTVQVQDQLNNLRSSDALTLNLSSTSAQGKFDIASSGAFNGTVTSVATSGGTATFYYKDTLSGTPTITVASGSLTSGTQQQSVSLVPLILTSPDPATSQTFKVGTTQTIAWTSLASFCPAAVNIKYSTDSGATYNSVIFTAIANTVGSNSYAWTVPAAVGTHVRIKIEDSNNALVFDSSRADLTIAYPSITITSPNGGESWVAGSTHNITWTTDSPAISAVKLEYSTDAGTTWNLITASAPNTGSYSWTLSDLFTTSQLKVRATGLAGVTSLTLSGSAASKMSGIAYLESNKTLFADVLNDFSAGDTLVISGHKFCNFSVSDVNHLWLDLYDNGASDAKTIQVSAT